MNLDQYIVSVGLEVHCQLATKSKLFCADEALFGSDPNTHISEISLAYPGTLPMLNREAVKMAIKMALVCHSKINELSYFERKHYNYPDLPKGYQLTQNSQPYCVGGFVPIQVVGQEKKISLHHIHLEEDAGKNNHDILKEYSCIDYNRAGVPLIEIVSNPDMNSGDEAVAFMQNIRKIVRYLNISDANMENGNLRCDVNISVRPKGINELGTKVEIKNLNSLKSIKKVIEFETKRIIDVIKNNGKVIQETRGFNPLNDTTFSQRDKEDAADYRYFNDPDLIVLKIKEEEIQSLKHDLPALHFEREQKLINDYGLSFITAKQLCEDRESIEYYETIITQTTEYKAAANWVLGPIQAYINSNKLSIGEFSIHAIKIAEIINIIADKRINYTDASTLLFNALLKEPKTNVITLIEKLNLTQTNNENDNTELLNTIEKVLSTNAVKVKEYTHHNKKGLIGFFVGEVIKKLNIKINPKDVNDSVKKILDGKSKK